VNHAQDDIEQRVQLAGSNMFELLLFKVGYAQDSGQRDRYGINVFKVREIVEMPTITCVAGAKPEILGVVDIRGQIIPVINLARVMGCQARSGTKKILLVTEFARTTQGFAVEEVDDIVRLEWNQILSAESSAHGNMVTSFARLDGDIDGSQLAKVLDVEQILRDVLPTSIQEISAEKTGQLLLKPGAKVLAADDSGVARSLIEQSLAAMGVPYVMTKTGREAWEMLERLDREAQATGACVDDHIAMVLTDLEMPEMDGFTLTRRIKDTASLRHIPVVIHSSLSGSANEEHVRKVGANGYVSKFAPSELASVIRKALIEKAV